MDYDKELLELLDETIAPNGSVDDKAFEHFYNKFAEDLMYIGEPSQDEECNCDLDEEDEDAEHNDDCEADSWGAWSDSTLKHKIFSYGPVRPAGVGNYPKDKNDLPYVLAYHAYENPEFTDEVADEIVSFMGGDVSESSTDLEILYTASMDSLEYSDVQKIFELGQKNPTAYISTVVYSEETVVTVYKGKLLSYEELTKEVEEYLES